MRAVMRCQRVLKGRRCYILPVESWGALGRKQVVLRPGLGGWKEEGNCWVLGGRDVVRTEEDSTALWKGQKDVQVGQCVSWEKGHYRRGGDNQPLSAARDERLEWDYLNIFREDYLWGIQLPSLKPWRKRTTLAIYIHFLLQHFTYTLTSDDLCNPGCVE